MSRRRTTTAGDAEALRLRVRRVYGQTGSIRGVARRLGMRRRKVRAALRGEPLCGPPKGRAPRPSKLDPFRPVIQRLVLEDKLSAVLVLEEIRQLGYQGGYSILKDYVRLIRPQPRAKVTTVLEHPPGAEGQVDWSPYRVQIGGEQRLVHAFSLVLPFSRFMVVRFALDEQLDTLLRLHDEVFAVLGAIPRLMTYDNMTTVGQRRPSGEIELTARFEDYRHGCGFEVALIDPGRPNQHGSVERPFHYVEHNCLRRRRLRFDDLADLNRHAAWWCDTVANRRVHGSTRERPVDRLLRERPLMLPLPSMRPEPFRLLSRTVGTDYCVAVDTNRYSVPPRHVRQPATVRLYPERLEVLVGGAVVAVHGLCRGRYQRLVLPEHEEAFRRLTPSRRLLEQAFLRLGPEATSYYDGLKQQRGRGAGYHLQRILQLADRHGAQVISGAMAHAARYGNYSAEAVARVVAGRELVDRSAPEHSAVPSPPERVRRWLEAIHVEDADLSDYDRLIDGLDGLDLSDPGDDDAQD
jgi:transposase